MDGQRLHDAVDDQVVAQLRAVLDGRWGWVRDQLRERLAGSDFAQPNEPLTMQAYRERTTGQLFSLIEEPYARMGFTLEQGGSGDPGGCLTAFEMFGHVDLSLLVKLGVQYGLFAGAVGGLGTHQHHVDYLQPALTGELLGCFAMTESAGGSDVAQLKTTARYDPLTDELVITTPARDARKDYIGNAAKDGRIAAVFAQLQVGEEHHGVHCVLVPIRDAKGAAMPGVTLEDCGPKIGLPGVDNGRISFDQVRVPRTNLLDRFGTISAEGQYASPIENPNRRFFTMLGALVRGRVSVGAAAGAATRNALTIAIKHGDRRTQFLRPATHEPIRQPHHRRSPRGLRRRWVHVGEPVWRAQDGYRRLHHLRGRQHGAGALGGQRLV